MNKTLPTLLLVFVSLFLALAGVFAIRQISFKPTVPPPQSDTQAAGTVLVDVPWKHFPDIPQFKLTDQTDSEFDSAVLSGKPYLVSFFFAGCPSICKDLNRQIEYLNKQLRKEDIAFVSITVDAENDTPEVLGRYAQDHGAEVGRWNFLTGQPAEIKQLGEHVFNVIIDLDTHTEDILLIDKWGRYRDRFKWDDPYDMKRLLEVTTNVAAETKPPMDQTVNTRNAMAGVEPSNWNNVKWIREFYLTERNGETFYSRDMIGKVWIANFFFSTCPGICKEQNEYLRGLQDRLNDHPATIVSITTRGNTDSLPVLNEYARKLGADEERWKFCTGNEKLVKRISGEYFKAHATADHHSSLFFLVDRWGNVRGQFDWQIPEQEVAMLKMIDQLNTETVPPASFEVQK